MWFLASPKQEEKKSPQGKQTPSQGQDKHPKMRKRRGFLERWEDITYILDIQLHLHLSLFFAFFLIVSDISLSLFSLYITTSVLLQSLSSELTGLCMIQDLDHFYSDWFHPLSITLCLFLMDLFFFLPRVMFACSVCKFRSFYKEEMETHLESRFHKDHFKFLSGQLSKPTTDFLQVTEVCQTSHLDTLTCSRCMKGFVSSQIAHSH